MLAALPYAAARAPRRCYVRHAEAAGSTRRGGPAPPGGERGREGGARAGEMREHATTDLQKLITFGLVVKRLIG